MSSLQSTARWLLAAALAFAAGVASAAYPEAPVRIIIPYTAGAGTDVMFRQITPYLEKELGANIVLINKPGANGDIGNDMAAAAKPDGYTLIVNSTNVLLSPLMTREARYSFDRSFVPISQVVTAQLLMIARPGAPFGTFGEFVSYCKAHPNQLNFGGAGIGAPPDLMAEIVRMRAPAPFTTVPYKGMGAVMTDLLGGTVDFTFTSSSNVKQYIEAGKLRAIVISGEKRSPNYPAIPTFSELGVDVEPMSRGFWWGMFAPANTPKPIVQQVANALARALQVPELVQKLEENGYTPAPNSPEQFMAQLSAENTMWKKIVPKMVNR
jgi:tripartite-type tricarboxylate transporter receptor subunit TctC